MDNNNKTMFSAASWQTGLGLAAAGRAGGSWPARRGLAGPPCRSQSMSGVRHPANIIMDTSHNLSSDTGAAKKTD